MSRSTFSGPVKSKAGMEIGDSGTQLTNVTKATSAVVGSGVIAPGASADVALPGISMSPGDAAYATPLAPLVAGPNAGLNWCVVDDASGGATLRVSNVSAAPSIAYDGSWEVVVISS